MLHRKNRLHDPSEEPENAPGLPEGFWSAFEMDLNRVLAAQTPKSEDLVRYAFFQSLVASGVEVHRFGPDVLLDVFYPALDAMG